MYMVGIKKNILLFTLLLLNTCLIILLGLILPRNAVYFYASFLGLVILFIGFLYWLLQILEVHKRKTIFLILLVGLLFKIICLLTINSLVTFPDELGVYDNFSWRQTKSWLGEDDFRINSSDYTSSNQVYYYFLAIIYYLFGHSVIIAKLFNLFLSLLSGLLIFLLVQKIFEDIQISIISLVLVLFSLSLNIWTLVLLRESLMIFLLSLSFYSIVQLVYPIRVRYLIMLIVCMGLLVSVRSYITKVLFLAIVIHVLILILRKHKRFGYIFITGMFFVTAIILFLFIFYSADLINFKNVNAHRKIIATNGNSGFLQNVDISNFQKTISFLPQGLAYFFFSPFIWDLSDYKRIALIPDTIFWYIIWLFVFLGIIITVKNKRIWSVSYLITFCGLIIVLYSLIDGNLGLLHRHRIQATYFLLIFGAVGLKYFAAFFKGILEKIKNKNYSIHNDAY